VPFVLTGTTEDLAWGISASLVDTSDIYREKINSKSKKYEVDGEQKSLKIERYDIKVKGEETIKFEVQSTHRGPVISTDLLKETSPLFRN
jgi:penicillin amidase